jgi:hypothetical protein
MGLAGTPNLTAANKHQTIPESPCCAAGAFFARAVIHRRARDTTTHARCSSGLAPQQPSLRDSHHGTHFARDVRQLVSNRPQPRGVLDD